MTPTTVAERYASRHLHHRVARAARPVTGELWHVWPGRNRPATAVEEEAFVARLLALAGRPTGTSAGEVPLRSDVTALLNALRCGIDADDLLRRAPGLDPAALALAHEHLDDRRRRSLRAWAAIVARPTPDALVEHGAEAAKLVPVLVDRLVGLVAADPEGLPGAVAGADGETRRVGRVALSVEEWMAEPSTVAGRSDEAGRLLYDLGEPGLWSHAAYLPVRVGTLVPVRVAALLGERRT